MQIKFYATLRDVVGASSIEMPEAAGKTASEVLAALILRYPGLKKELLSSNGELYPHVHFFVNGRDVQFLECGLDTILQVEDSVTIFPAVGGG